MPKSPGTENAAFIAFSLVNDLLHMLRERGILSADDITGLLKSTADRLSEDPSAVAKRSARFISNSILPEHKIE